MRTPSLDGIRFQLRRAHRPKRLVKEVHQRSFQARLRRRGIAIGEGVFIAPGSDVSALAGIGRGSVVPRPAAFRGEQPIRVGNYCSIGDHVLINTTNHRLDHANTQVALHARLGLGQGLKKSRGPVTIGNNVFIGDMTIVLDGVTIGDGAVVGTGAVVTKDVPPFAVVAGSPARLIRMRFDEAEIDRQLRLAWWDWSEDEMRRNADLFREPLI